MIKARYMTGFWNVIKRRRSIQVKSSLTTSDFNSFYGDVMQYLPESSHDQTCDKNVFFYKYSMDNCHTMEAQTIEQVNQRRGSVVVSTSTCHAADRGSIPGPVALLVVKIWLSTLYIVYFCVFRRRH